MRTTILVIALVFILSGASFAQGTPSPTPSVPGDTVPAWVLYWVLGLASFFGAALITVIKILWAEARKTSGLSEDERHQLSQMFEWHSQKDDDQIPLWYVPRSWVDLIHKLREDHAIVQGLLTRIVEQSEGVNADLRQQLKERLELHDRQQTKMLKLAVRVQQAVEALAGLEPPKIESDLDDEDD